MKIRVPDKLSDEDIEEYRKIYKEARGKDISFAEAEELAMSLLRLIFLVLSDSDENDK